MIQMKKRDFPEWKIPQYDHDDANGYAHKVIVAFDVEYEANTEVTDKDGQIVDQRDWDDIISIQLAYNYENRSPRKLFIHRDRGDRYFTFYEDVMKPLKQYLHDIGVMPELKRSLRMGGIKAFNVELWGFWAGVDISSFTDYVKILTEDGNENKPSNLVTINGNTVFTSRPLKLLVRNSNRQRWDLFPKMRLVMRDMKKLAPAKSNLAALGEMLNLPKLDTEKWDAEAGLEPGYFKTHMSELWKKWPQRFEDYAMRDTVITALYGTFILEFMQELNDSKLGKFKPVTLKSSLSSIVGNVALQKNKMAATWINDVIIKDLIIKMNASNCTVDDYYKYLKPLCRPQKKDENFQIDVPCLYQLLKVSSFDTLSHDAYNQAMQWLNYHLDYDKIRKGYWFPKDDQVKNKNHKKMTNDKLHREDLPLFQLFDDAVKAYHGGFNLVTKVGVIPAGPLKLDGDLKSAYNTGGHLIPDVALGLGIKKHFEKLNADQFQDVVNYAETINGPYTIGVGTFTIQYPDDYRGFMITPSKVEDGPRYFRHIPDATLSYTDAYAAWTCGATVNVHRLDFLFQANFEPKSMQGVCNEGIVQDIFQQRREKYPKGNPKNTMNKEIGNSCYGATCQGIEAHKSRNLNGQSYLLPFSAITNAIKGMQYTAITRYHITLLQKAIHQVDPDAIFLNNVTDGMLIQIDHPLDEAKVTAAMNQLAHPLYRSVVKNHFHGIYFEAKDSSTDATANLKTRMTFSRDNQLHAMVGIPSSLATPEEIFKTHLDHNATKIPLHKHIISGIVDMKNDKKFELYEQSWLSGHSSATRDTINFKHLQRSWDQPSDTFLGYDFACWPTQYHVNDQYCIWDTVFYPDEETFLPLWTMGRILIKYGPMYSAEWAPYFQRTLQEKQQNLDADIPYLGEALKDDDDNPKIGNEIYYNYAYYAARYQLEPTDAYQRIINLISNNGYPFIYGKKNQLPTLATFKRFLKNHRNFKDAIINYVLLHQVGLI